jgi:hypothetical protein
VAFNGENQVDPAKLMELEDIEDKLKSLGIELNAQLMIKHLQREVEELKSKEPTLSQDTIQKIINITYDVFLDTTIDVAIEGVFGIVGGTIGQVYIDLAAAEYKGKRLKGILIALWKALPDELKAATGADTVQTMENFLK